MIHANSSKTIAADDAVGNAWRGGETTDPAAIVINDSTACDGRRGRVFAGYPTTIRFDNTIRDSWRRTTSVRVAFLNTADATTIVSSTIRDGKSTYN